MPGKTVTVPDELLDLPVAVHLRGVDVGHAELDAEAEGRDLIPPARRVLAHVPGSQAQRWNFLAFWQRCRLHAALLSHNSITNRTANTTVLAGLFARNGRAACGGLASRA